MVKIENMLLVLLMLIRGVLGSNILVLLPMESPSYHMWYKVLSKGLINKGHNVTMLSPSVEKESINNFTVITMEGLHEASKKSFKRHSFARTSTLMAIKKMGYDHKQILCKNMNTEGLRTLIRYPKDFKFDLIIYDITNIKCLYPVIKRFNNPPVAGASAFVLQPFLAYSFGNHLQTSYVPYYISEFSTKMNMIERVLNFLYTYAEVLYRANIASFMEFDLAKNIFDDTIAPLEEIERNINLVLVNTNPVLSYPVALPPNIISVGGLHLKPAQTLPDDLKVIVESARHGVILFSLGSNLKSADLKTQHRKTLLNAFSRLPQIILWKFELDALEGLPKNVIIRKWLPQNDILGHPNTKLFISHGGLLSVEEAVYHGVPIIGIPFFADQYTNVCLMAEKGIAERLEIISNFTAEEVYKKIRKMLISNKYIDEMRKISRICRDQSQTALDRAIFWIEYVLRHGNVDHLTPAARDMPSYQTTSFDVSVAFFICGIFLHFLFKLIAIGCKCMVIMRSFSIEFVA